MYVLSNASCLGIMACFEQGWGLVELPVFSKSKTWLSCLPEVRVQANLFELQQ